MNFGGRDDLGTIGLDGLRHRLGTGGERSWLAVPVREGALSLDRGRPLEDEDTIDDRHQRCDECQACTPVELAVERIIAELRCEEHKGQELPHRSGEVEESDKVSDHRWETDAAGRQDEEKPHSDANVGKDSKSAGCLEGGVEAVQHVGCIRVADEVSRTQAILVAEKTQSRADPSSELSRAKLREREANLHEVASIATRDGEEVVADRQDRGVDRKFSVGENAVV